MVIVLPDGAVGLLKKYFTEELVTVKTVLQEVLMNNIKKAGHAFIPSVGLSERSEEIPE